MENNNQNYSHQALSIEKLMAAPFIAAADANAKMAREQAKFLMDTCFEQNGDSFRPKMVSLSMTRSSANNGGKEDTLQFELPLITIIPFNSLCITDMSMKFDMEIVAYTGSNATPEKDDQGKEKCTLHGNISYDSKENGAASKRRQSKMSVEINGGTIPLPPGLTTLIDFYSKNIKTS
ncbi:DUF2589 domain-containing protein [Rurimicrobium arvi]|uniref:DUF2589 domain-containing protein n=1 Tax=Rurimicrobium arvi TaxID=2049916 RepID=A0ABP8N0T8_9BACT